MRMLFGFRPRIAILLAAATPLAIVAAAVLYSFPPTAYSFYPPCVFHLVTGLHCPGCGATRCVYSLVHGDLRQAAAYNPLLLVILPFLAGWILCKSVPRIAPRRL